MVLTWDGLGPFLLGEAAADIEAGGGVRPCFVAMTGDAVLFVAYVRPFPAGRWLDPIVELVALAAPLRADRLALSISGRAWSLDDPIPPVVPGVGDLRQTVLTILTADGTGATVRARATCLPFDVVDGAVVWGEGLHQEGERSPLVAALAVAVRNLGKLQGSDEDVRAQAERCALLGHLVALSAPVHERLTR